MITTEKGVDFAISNFFFNFHFLQQDLTSHQKFFFFTFMIWSVEATTRLTKLQPLLYIFIYIQLASVARELAA